jgi:hypothetical protein
MQFGIQQIKGHFSFWSGNMPLDQVNFSSYSLGGESPGVISLDLIGNRISVGKYTPPLRNN